MRIMVTDRSLLGESRTNFLSHRECIEVKYEYANEFGKQGCKNPRNIPAHISEKYADAQSLLKATPTHPSALFFETIFF